MLGGGSHRLPPRSARTPGAPPGRGAGGMGLRLSPSLTGGQSHHLSIPEGCSPHPQGPGALPAGSCHGEGLCQSVARGARGGAGVSGAGFPPYPKPSPGPASLLDLIFFNYFLWLRRGWVVVAHLSSHLAASPGCCTSGIFKWALSLWLIAPGMICGGEGCSVGWR